MIPIISIVSIVDQYSTVLILFDTVQYDTVLYQYCIDTDLSVSVTELNKKSSIITKKRKISQYIYGGILGLHIIFIKLITRNNFKEKFATKEKASIQDKRKM